MRREDTIDFAIKAAWHAIARMYHQQAARHGITMSMGFVLLNIHSDGTPATKIAPLMGLESRSLSRLLRNMEEKGLIYREADDQDRRLVRIFLTREGRKKRQKAKDTVLRFNEVIRDHIDSGKLNVFFQVVSDIQRLVDSDQVNKPVSV